MTNLAKENNNELASVNNEKSYTCHSCVISFNYAGNKKTHGTGSMFAVTM